MEVMAARDWREGVVKKDLSFWRKVVMLLVKPSTAKSHVNALRFFHLDHSLLTTIFTDPVFPGSFNGASRDTVRVSASTSPLSITPFSTPLRPTPRLLPTQLSGTPNAINLDPILSRFQHSSNGQ